MFCLGVNDVNVKWLNQVYPVWEVVFFRGISGMIISIGLVLKFGLKTIKTNKPIAHTIRAVSAVACVTFYFFGLTYVLIKSLHPKNRVFHKITLAVYALIVLVSGVVFVIGSLTGYSAELYPTVRTLMGVAQSFIPMMALYLLFKFMPNKNDYPKKG